MKSRRLSEEKWKSLKEDYLNGISVVDLSKKYQISRHSVYAKGWNHGWISKNHSKKQSIWQKIKSYVFFLNK